MTINVLLLVLALSAVTFALLYGPALNRFSLSLASPYPKADVKRRLLAGSLDGSLLVTSLYFYQNSGSAWFVVAGAAYVMLRDAIQGRSVGKFFVGLAVISLETGRPCTFMGSVRRNLVFLLPGANVVAVFLEAITIVRDPHGNRLGDRLALTQVVVGFGARDLAESFVQDVRRFRGAIRDSPRTGTYRSSEPHAVPRRRPHAYRDCSNRLLAKTPNPNSGPLSLFGKGSREARALGGAPSSGRRPCA